MKNNSTQIICSVMLSLILSITTFTTLNAQVQDSLTVNTGNVASAIGMGSSATGNYSLAAGYYSEATGSISVALGYQSKAKYVKSVAIGENCESRHQGYSFGQNAKALGQQSLAIGRFVETDEYLGINSIVLGSCNDVCVLKNNKANSLMVGFNSTVPTLFVSEAEDAFYFDGIGKVGIGTSEPKARLQVADGDIFIQDINKGIIMKSPDGNCWRGTVNNSGQLVFVKLDDCENLTDNKPVNQTENSVKITPNPASGYFEVNCSNEDLQKYSTLSLYDISGNVVFSQQLDSTVNRISTSNLKSGTYVIRMHGKYDSFSDTIIISK